MKKYVFILLSSLCLSGCAAVNETDYIQSVPTIADETESTEEIVTEESEPEPVVQTYQVSMCAVGDNLIHSPIYRKADNGDGTYDFTKMYENVSDRIKQYDIAVINQETILVEDDAKVSSYPTFGTPWEMSEAVMDAGFDVVLTATNHTMDKGTSGIQTSYKIWKDNTDLTILGTYDDAEADHYKLYSQNNISFAMFNYTYGLNGIPISDEDSWMVDQTADEVRFVNDIESVKDTVDFVVCFVHIGSEYVYEPTEYQTTYVEHLIDAGADVVICSHPHVIEPYEYITTDAGNTGLVYWSCGNFISGQDEWERMLGGMASIEFEKTVVDGEVTNTEISSYTFVPTVTHYTTTEHTVYWLADYTEELASEHKLAYKGLSLSNLWGLFYDVTGQVVAE